MLKKMQRMIALVLVAASILLLAACGSNPGQKTDTGNADNASGTSSTSSTGVPKEHVIAVAVASYTTEILGAKDYFENYLADALNIKFIFSDEIGRDVANIMTFVENAYNSGAEAIIDCACTTDEDLKPIAAKCDELGMYLITWMTGNDAHTEFNNLVGMVGNNVEVLNKEFNHAISAVLSDGEDHSVVLCTMNARYGNQEQIQASVGVLQALKDIYGLEYTDEMENLVKADTVTEIETGNENVKVAIFPSYSADEMREVLKNGDYDTVAVVGPVYLRFEATVKEMEELHKKDIKMITWTSVADSTENSFVTTDIAGKSSLDAALLSNKSRFAILFVLAVNAVNGDADAVMVNGEPAKYYTPSWGCFSKEDYDFIKTIDVDESNYIYTLDEIKQMIKAYNPDLTPEVINEWTDKATLDSVMERRGLSK